MNDYEFMVVKKKGNSDILSDTLMFKNSHELINYIDLNNINPADKTYKIYKLKEISFTKTITIDFIGEI
jgi:hypothetical protein